MFYAVKYQGGSFYHL